MAYDMYDDDGRPVNPPKKADVILRYEREISGKTDDISDRARVSLARIEQLLDEVDQVHKDNAAIARQNGEIYSAVSEDIEALRSELKFLALQNESIYSRLTEKLAQLEEQVQNGSTGESAPLVTAEGEIDYDKLADKLAERLPEGRTVEGDMTHLTVELDYNNLARRVAERLSNGGEAIDYDALAAKVAERMPAGNGGAIDYDVLVDKMVARLPMQDNYSVAPAAVASIDGQTLDYDMLADKLAERLPAQEAAATATVDATDLDLDALARKVASYVPKQGAVASISDVNLDCDELADKVVSRMPMYEAVSPDYIASKVAEQLIIPDIKAQADIDLDELADKVAARMPKQKSIFGDGTRLTVELDYDMLADKVAERIPGVTTDEDGNPVRVVRESSNASIDYEVLAEKISNYLPYGEALVEGENVSLDYDMLADKVAERIPAAQTVSTANVEIDEEDLADRIALKVGAIRAEDFDVLVDDDGCQTITKGITENLDYEYIANTVAEKLRPQLELEDEAEPDYEEMAQRISEKITVAGINEDAIADKAAQALSNYLPEIDADEIADKVASQVISAMPELTVDTDYISNTVSEKIVEMQADHDYDIVLDEESLKTITEQVSESVSQKAEERFSNIDGEIADLKAMMEEGVALRETEKVDYSEMAQRISENITVAGVDEDAIAQKAAAVLSEYVYDTDEIAEKVAEKVVAALPEEKSEEDYNIVLDENGINEVTEKVSESVTAGTEERFDAIDREIAEIKEILETRPAVVISEAAPAQAYEETVEEEEEEQLVTVSDLIAEEEVEEPVEEVAEEPVVEEVVEQPVEEVAEPEEDNDEDDGEEGDEETLEEFSYDELAGEGEGGVDFANMMRYNRSFIARIIQSTDDQKAYYGEVRNALLSYKKVNSNIAWGAERFHKGRETIARFKIRGKTLVLYLALDPAEHEFSVYHHKDVSNNRSVAGTPMMIKIKSPRGVKKAVRLIDEMLEARGGIKRNVPERDYAAMYPYETMEELIEDGLVKDVRKDK